MRQKILVPLDGSETAEAILPQVMRLLQRQPADVVLVEVLGLFPPDFHWSEPETEKRAQRYLRKRSFEFIQRGVEAKFRLRMGSPAPAILETAREERATLIALSTHGRSGLSRFMLGSVAEEVLRTSPVPVLVFRPPEDPRLSRGRIEALPLHSYLLPTDGSEESLSVLPELLEWARPADSRVTLLAVRPRGEADQRWPVEEVPIREAERRLREALIPTAFKIRHGEAAEEILQEARDGRADLVVMATHGRRGPSRWIFGSVTAEVLRTCPVPLMVVHRSPRAPRKLLA
jgi:nucleotide-binding universal stress UspA family protein